MKRSLSCSVVLSTRTNRVTPEERSSRQPVSKEKLGDKLNDSLVEMCTVPAFQIINRHGAESDSNQVYPWAVKQFLLLLAEGGVAAQIDRAERRVETRPPDLRIIPYFLSLQPVPTFLFLLVIFLHPKNACEF